MRLAILAILLFFPPQNGMPLHPQNKPQTSSHNAHPAEPQKTPKPEVPQEETGEQNSAPHQAPYEQKAPVSAKPGFDYVFGGFWVNLALVLVTFLLAIYAVKQAKAARDSVIAMREANQINRDSLQTVQRAYVTFPLLDMQPPLRMADSVTGNIISWQFRTAIENTGNTPARDVRNRINYQWQEGIDGLPNSFTFPDYGAEEAIINLSAKVKTYSQLLTIEDAIIQRVYAKQCRLYFYGWATYKGFSATVASG